MAKKAATTSLSLSPDALQALLTHHEVFDCKSLSSAASDLILGSKNKSEAYDRLIASQDDLIKSLNETVDSFRRIEEYQNSAIELTRSVLGQALGLFLSGGLTKEIAQTLITAHVEQGEI